MGKISGEEGWISLGPWGGKGGVYSTYKPDGPIVQITIRYGDVVDSILFESKSGDEVVIGSSVKIGGTGGGSSAKFCIDSSVEQFSSVSLTYRNYHGPVVVSSFGVNTNLMKYGPFGLGGGHSVFIPIEGEVITGFHGRGGYFLDAIGIFVAPKVDSFSNSEINVNSLHSIEDPDYVPIQLKGKIIAEEGWISLGPWGGEGGGYKTYKPDGPIMEITIFYGDAIHSILFESKSRNGVVVGSSIKIGGTGGRRYAGRRYAKFCIDSSVEQFSSISLTYQESLVHGLVVVTSLCFNTNLKKYGPFGSEGFHSVSIPIEGGVIVGFHGRGGSYLDAIGIFVAPKADSFSNSEKNIDSLHSIQGPDFASTQLKFCIDTSEEQLSAINLTYEYEHFPRKVTIISLCICTNINKYGPFGLRSGVYSLSIPIPIEGGVLTGFHGRAGTHLSAIGILVAPKVNGLQPIQDPDSTPTQLKTAGLGVFRKVWRPEKVDNIMGRMRFTSSSRRHCKSIRQCYTSSQTAETKPSGFPYYTST